MARKKHREAYRPIEVTSNPRLSALENELNRIQVEQKNREGLRKSERGKRSVGQKIGEFFTGKTEKPDYHPPYGPEQQAAQNLMTRFISPRLIEEYQRDIDQSRMPLGEQVLGPVGNQFAQAIAGPALQQILQGPSRFAGLGGGNSFNNLLPGALGSLLVPFIQNYFKGPQQEQQEQQYEQDPRDNQLDQLLQQMGPRYQNTMNNPNVDPQLTRLLAMPQAQQEPFSQNQSASIQDIIRGERMRRKGAQHGQGFQWKRGMWR